MRLNFYYMLGMGFNNGKFLLSKLSLDMENEYLENIYWEWFDLINRCDLSSCKINQW